MKRVVITGMGAATPIGCSVKEYTDSLFAGKNGIGKITRFDVGDSKFTLAAELKNFDPLTRLEKPLVRKNDPYTVYALFAADEAMEDSGIAGKIDPEELGVYIGSGIGGFDTFCHEHSVLLETGAKRVAPQFIPKLISNIAAASVAIRHNAHGPCMAHVTACATSSTAIGEGYRAIQFGSAKAILCGGSEATINPLAVAGFANCMALSPSDDPNAASLPFDIRRGGFVMGEGAGVLLLEEYEHAVNRGAKIYAEVVGYGTTCDAHHVTAPDPTAKDVARAIRLALPEELPENIYYNAHGTGTKLNDLTETSALRQVFGEDAKKIHISSTKSMTGHMLGAAGAAEAIACVAALNRGMIPPTINLKEPDPECDLDYTPNEAKPLDIGLALSASLGFGGHNVCLAFRKI